MLFYFILKALSVLKYLSFCLEFLIMYKKWLDEKPKVNFKIYDVKTLLITIHMLPNISRTKKNHTIIKFGYLRK